MSKDFTKALDDLRHEIESELRGLKDSVNYCSQSCDDLKNVADDIKELRSEIQNLTKHNQELKSENRNLTDRLEEMEQYQRVNNLEIKGAPGQDDPTAIVKLIGEFVGELITDADIDICHNVPTQKPAEKKHYRTVCTKQQKKLAEGKMQKETHNDHRSWYCWSGVSCVRK